VARGQLSGASDSLQTAFMTNELNSAVLGLERPLKEKVADFNASLDQMRNLIEARDFGNLEILLQKMKSSATDFDTTKPMAIVNGVKLESKMRLGKAKLAAQQGNLKLAMEEFQVAAEAWPGNPDLQDKALSFFDTQDVKSQALVEFDRLVEEQNYRTIFDKQLGFAPATKGDAKREEALKTALLAIKDAEIASEKANALMLNGDFFGAWEAIELASTKLPDDKKLNKLRADLSGRSAEFVSAINKARDAEARNEIGFSITWFVNAQRQYPASQIANEGVERLSKKLIEAKM
jgi:tetratricopeptide (TPR) repeat protein